jgi:hypothetical protein
VTAAAQAAQAAGTGASSRAVEPDRAGRHPILRVGFGIQAALATRQLLAADGLGAGYTVALEVPVRRFRLEARAALFPHVIRSAADTSSCAADFTGGTPTPTETTGAAQ